MKIVIERETAINNIAMMLYSRDLLSLPPNMDKMSRLEPMLSLSPVVEVIAEAICEGREYDSCADLQCPACYALMVEIRTCKKCGHTERR